jgi:hypothetical protein
MRRRDLLALFTLPALTARAGPASEVWDVVARMAAALAEDNPPGFLKPLDPRMPGYIELVTSVNGMLMQAQAHSGISAISNEGTDRERTVQLDWELRLTRKGNDLRIDVRRQTVTLKFTREDKQWRVTSLDPLSFFAPPDFR